MKNSLIQGIEVLAGPNRLVIRNTWVVASLGRYFVLGSGAFLFGGFSLAMILFWLNGVLVTTTERYLGLTTAIVAGPLAVLGLIGIGVHAFSHCKPFIFDKRTDRFRDDSTEICPLSSLASLCIEECGFDPVEYVIVLVRQEGMSRSVYEVLGLTREMHLTFQPRADSEHFCVALASMTSKYLRELLMGEFNQFWQRHVPGVKPTAGYPGDAARFLKDITPAAQRLGISEAALWRRK